MFQNQARGKGEGPFLGGVLALARAKWTSDAWTWILVGLGVFLRILEYSDNRRLYMDESALQPSLTDLAFYDFQTPLPGWQLAPPGFLAVERLMVLLPLPFAPAARLVPFFCAIASMFLMRSVARRYLTEIAVPIAVGLFAMTDWLLYYSVEIKQYSSDVALTLAAFLLAAGLRPSRTEGTHAMSLRDWLVFTAFGTIGVWFSFPLALVLAGMGSYLMLQAASRRAWYQALGIMAMSLGWAASFALCYWVSQSIVAKDDFLPRFWGFAFLPFPPRSVADLERIFLQTINLLNSPSGVLTPLGVISSMFIAVTLFVLGAWSLGRKWKGGLFLLASPIFFALLASTLHQYPFHGRLLLFLVPSVHLLVGEGAAFVSRPGGAKLTFAMGAFLFCQPVLDVLWHRLVAPRNHGDYDSHGDVAHDLLDYLEDLEKKKKIDEMVQRAIAERLKQTEAIPSDSQPPFTPP